MLPGLPWMTASRTRLEWGKVTPHLGPGPSLWGILAAALPAGSPQRSQGTSSLFSDAQTCSRPPLDLSPRVRGPQGLSAVSAPQPWCQRGTWSHLQMRRREAALSLKTLR